MTDTAPQVASTVTDEDRLIHRVHRPCGRALCGKPPFDGVDTQKTANRCVVCVEVSESGRLFCMPCFIGSFGS